MIIEIILFIIICVVFYIFAIVNYKKCETGGERIIFMFYIIIVSIPIIIYYLDLWNIPSKFNLTKNINSQNWLNFLFTYTSTIIASIIGVTASIYIAYMQIRKNNEETERRDKENLRLQNMPLLQFECKEEKSTNNKLTELETNIEDGIVQQINLSLKNIGLNTIRKSYISIKSDILKREYCFQLDNQGSIEKNQDEIISFVLKLFVDTIYKFEITVYYQDLLFNNYKQNITLQYEVLKIRNGNSDYYNNSKFIIKDESQIDKIPKLILDEL